MRRETLRRFVPFQLKWVEYLELTGRIAVVLPPNRRSTGAAYMAHSNCVRPIRFNKVCRPCLPCEDAPMKAHYPLRRVLAFCALLGLCGAAIAQEPPPPKPDGVADRYLEIREAGQRNLAASLATA